MLLGSNALRHTVSPTVALVSRISRAIKSKHLQVSALPKTSKLITCHRTTMSDSVVIEKGKASQPEWAHPQALVEEPVLRVYNSMTRTKVRVQRLG